MRLNTAFVALAIQTPGKNSFMVMPESRGFHKAFFPTRVVVPPKTSVVPFASSCGRRSNAYMIPSTKLRMDATETPHIEMEQLEKHTQNSVDNIENDTTKSKTSVGSIRSNESLNNLNQEETNQKIKRFPIDKSSASKFLEGIGNHRLLNREEEIALGRQIQILVKWEKIREELEATLMRSATDDEWASAIQKGLTVKKLKRQIRDSRKAKANLVESNLRLVISIAKKYVGRTDHLTLMDLVQEGTLGLHRAAKKFDPERGFRFSTYATWWVRKFCLQAVAKENHVPVHVQNQVNALRRAERDLRDELGRDATSEELCETMDLSMKRVEFLKRRALLRIISVETVLGNGKTKGSAAGGGGATNSNNNSSGGGDRDFTLQDTLSDPGEIPTDVVANNMLREDVKNLLDDLTTRERDIIRMRFGLEDGEEKTMEEIKQRLSISKRRIYQIEKKALEKLRRRTNRMGETLNRWETLLP